jgi:hypothetical protein
VKFLKERLAGGTYVVLVRSLYQTLLPSTLMAVAFLGVSLEVILTTWDPLLFGIMLLGIAAAAGRLIVVLRYRSIANSPILDSARARSIERYFAIPYLAFAALLGAFSARVFQIATAESHMLVLGLIFGYAAGVTASVFLRHWIPRYPSHPTRPCRPHVIVAVTPDDSRTLSARRPSCLCLFRGGATQRNDPLGITARRP